jgi:hypothetical protein
MKKYLLPKNFYRSKKYSHVAACIVEKYATITHVWDGIDPQQQKTYEEKAGTIKCLKIVGSVAYVTT